MENPNPQAGSAWKVLHFLASVFAGLMLTIIAIPLLFFATCFPIFLGHEHNGDVLIGIAAAVTAVFGYGMSYRFENPGTRWGVLLVTTAAIAAEIYILIH